MNRRARRRVLLSISAAVAVVLIVGGGVAVEAIKIGVAYKAKTVCSGVFVSGRDLAAVMTELHADDLAILRYILASIDSAQHSVTASALGIVRRRAVYREGLGCALVLEGLTPPTLLDRGHTTVAVSSLLQHHSGELEAAVARAFSEPDPERPRRTLAVVVMYRGTIVAERYANGIGPAPRPV